MISVGNVHGRGLGFGKERMVDDTELEEGEAGTYMEENDQQIDPDVSFAYIGEKLQDLLGNYQKDFEGCFTAENLGPKFGAYGSFLPTIQRSPSSLHPMTPRVHVQNNFPNTITSSLGASKCFAIPSTARQKEQHELGPTTVSKLSSVVPTVHDSVHKDASLKPTLVSEINPKSEDAKQLPTVVPNNINDSVERDAIMNSTRVEGINAESGDSKQFIKLAGRKPIRIRITMNSKKLLPHNNAATISGLDPNSSLLTSNTTKDKGVSLGSQDILPKTPNDIIRSMTASPVPRSSILSPLPDYLTYLTKNEKQQKDCSTNGNHPMKEDFPDSKNSEKNLKPEKKKSHPTVSESAEESDRVPQMSMAANRSVVKGNSNLDLCEREPPGFEPTQLVGPVNKKHNGTDTKCHGHSYRTSVGDEEAVGLVKDGMPFSGLTVNEKAASHQQDAPKTSPRVAEGGKRSEDCNTQRIPLPYLSKGSQILGSSFKPGKMHGTAGLSNNSRSENMNLQRGFEKTKDTYKEIFGDLSTEDEENELVFHETSSDCMNKKSEILYNKKITAPVYKPKVKESCKKLKESVAIDGCTAVDLSASLPVDLHNADISVASAAIPIQDNWVFCDRCKRWRLLPLHVDTISLPEKWTCRMMTWLPGMNHCKVSEEETTRAVRALYEFSVPENHMKVDVGLGGITSGVCTGNKDFPGQTFSSISVPVSMKKKHGSTKLSESSDLQCTTKLQQSKPSDFGTEKNMAKMPKKFLSGKGVTGKKQRTENRRESYHGSPRVGDVSCAGIIMADQDQSIYKDYLPFKKSKTKNARLRVSSDDSSLEMQMVDDNHLAINKRNIRECSESGQLAWVNHSSHETFIQGDPRRRKRLKLSQSGLNDFISSEGNGRPREKVDTMNVHKSAKVPGTNLSKLNMCDVHPGKKNLGSLKSIAPESSSSKLSSSQKSKMEIEGVKASPVGSVSSTPLCGPKKDQHIIRKRSFLRQDNLMDKSLLGKFEDEPLQSADKSNSSCTISGSKEDISSVEKRSEKKYKVLIKNAVKSCKRDTDADMSSESSKQTGHHKSVEHEVQADLFSSERALSKQIVNGGSQCRFLAENNQPNTSSGADKLLSGPVFNAHDENTIFSSQDVPKSQHSNDFHTVSAAAIDDNNVKGPLKSCSQRVNQLSSTTPHTQDGLRTKDFGERKLSTIRKDIPNVAIIIEKEARSLKYIADRFGESGSACEKVGIYFQSALKFLNAASLYESSCCESARLGDRNHSIQIYRSTTKLFEFCAVEFEKLNNIFAVALAYKCMEVACLQVVNSSHRSASKDLLELQTAVPPGESPSPCFSDVDNSNNVAIVDQYSLATEGLVIPAQNRPNLIQLLTFTEDVEMAMDSSQKSRTAFMAANAVSVNSESISLVKKALDFSFQDVDEFLHLVRFAMEAISG